jgi:hypothetical protein
MKLTLKRAFDDGKVTLGMLEVPGLDEPIYTLEEPWRDNMRNISCVPPGVYRCTPHNGTKFQDVWKLEAVPGRSYILIHAGNHTGHIEGCILVGLTHGWLGDKRAVLNSGSAINKLRKHIGTQNSFTLHIM